MYTKNIRLSLNEGNFASLIKGEILEIEGNDVAIKIILQDIGWHRMIDIIETEMNKID